MKNTVKYPIQSQSANRLWAEQKPLTEHSLLTSSCGPRDLMVIKTRGHLQTPATSRKVSVTMAQAVRIRDLCNDSKSCPEH